LIAGDIEMTKIDPRTPSDLMAAGVTTLPCGFPLTKGRQGFRDRIKHYRQCPDAYCQHRWTIGANLGRELAKGIKGDRT
jgi:hypothetical protein